MTWWFNWRTSGSVTRAIWDRAMTWSFLKLLLVLSLVRSGIMRVTWYFLKFWPVTVWAKWSDLIGLYGFVVRMERSDWLVRLLSPYGTIWLACTAFESVWNDMIGVYGFWVRMERSDWHVRILSLYGTIWLVVLEICLRAPRWTSCSMKLQTVVSRKTRKRYVKCVLFYDEFAVRPAVARDTNKPLSLFIDYLLYPAE